MNITTSKRKYGLDWPSQVCTEQIDLLCAKHWREPEYRAGNLLDPGEHMLQAIRSLFSPSEWTISPWTEEHAHAWCNETWLGVIGCAASSKSWDLGGLAMLDYIIDPTSTVTIMASTSKMALADRTFASAIKLFRSLKRRSRFMVPGKVSKSTMAIVMDDDEYGDLTTDKTALRGVALAQGTAEEARGSLQGRHTCHLRLIGDELAAMKPSIAAAFVDARTNLSIGAEKDFKFVFLANPESKLDVCGQLCTPVDGWASVDEHTESWRTKYGLILHRNGYKSPAVLDPDGPAKYPYLIRQDQIDVIVNEEHGNAASKRVWVMIKGFPPPTGLDNTVLNETDIEAFSMRAPVRWDDRRLQPEAPTKVAGLDPAFSSGGDSCVLISASVGVFDGGRLGVAFDPPFYIPIDADSKRPPAYQVSDGAIQYCMANNIPFSNLAVDDSGTQSVCDILVVETGDSSVIRCNFGARASEAPLGLSPRPASKDARNAVTEIWMLVAALGRSGQIRQMPAKVAEQFCKRQFKLAGGGKTKALEDKRDFKKRLGGRSPDEGDAFALTCLAARKVAGLTPGADRPANTPNFSLGFQLPASMGKTLKTSYKPLDFSRLSTYTRGS